MDEVADVAIVGAGPAGIAAAIYLRRAGLSPLHFEKGRPGGLVRNANLVENYPGFPRGIRGEELADLFVEQLGAVRGEVRQEEVKSVSAGAGLFHVSTDAGEYGARAVVLATGTSPRRTRIPGVRALIGKKAFYEIVSAPLDGNEGKKVLIVGGGDAAFDYALALRGRGHAAVVVARSEPRCLPLLRSRAEQAAVDVRVGYRPERLEEWGDGVALVCRTASGVRRLEGDLVLLACGREPNLSVLAAPLLHRAKAAACPPATQVPGLYVAGDVVRGHNRQTGIAVGDGILAAMLAEEHLRKRRRS